MPTSLPHSHTPDLRPLLAPQSIAVVGASDRPGAGSIVLDNLRRLSFPGPVYPVNPRYSELGGWRCYSNLKDIPGPVDSVAILLSYRQVLPALEQAAAIGAKAAWVLASGFAEAGPEGKALQDDVVACARAHGIALCGPNCVGVVNLHARAGTYSAALPATLKPGHVGAVLQSGAICLGIANSNRGVGFSTLISSGNEAALDNADYISHLVDDPQTRVIIAFVEGFKHPENFISAAERARQAGKPLLVVKVGRSAVAQRATLAHTGSLAGSGAVHDAVFRKHGVIRLDGLDELLEAAELFLKAPLPAGRGMGLLTLSGGQIGLVGDLMQGIDLDLPELGEDARRKLAQVLPPYSNIANPLDAWGAGDFEETYPACMEILGRQENIHLLAVSRDSPPGIAEREVWQSSVIVDAAARVAGASGKPVVVFSNMATGFDKAVQDRADAQGLPMLQGTRASLRAIQALVQHAEFLRRPVRQPGPSPVSLQVLARIKNDLSQQPAGLNENASKQLLAEYGVPVTHEALARSATEAARLAKEIGAPVALKIQSSDIQHKTEAGGVVLSLTGARAIRQAFDQIMRNARSYNRSARIEGVLVQEMVPADAVEVIVGSSNDEDFGPVVVFGLGGIMVELFKDSVLRLAPVSLEEAHEMIASIRGAALLRGFRGRLAADAEALADAIVRVSHLACDLQDEIAAVDINPLMVRPQGLGVLAADALVIKH